MGIVLLIIISMATLACCAYLLYQVYILREQIDSLETKLLRARLSKNATIRHANIDSIVGD